MIHMLNLSFEEVNPVNVAVDTKKCVIHLLETDNASCTRVSHAIKHVQNHIVERIETFHPCKDNRWLLYDLDGAVSEYCDGAFTPIDLKHNDVYEPFSKKMMILKTGHLFS